MKLYIIALVLAIGIYLAGLDTIFNFWDTITGHFYKIERLFKNISYLIALIVTMIAIFTPQVYRYFESEDFDNWIVKLPKHNKYNPHYTDPYKLESE